MAETAVPVRSSIEYDPFSPVWRPDPYSKYRELRDEAPVFYSPDANVWCISRYDDVLAVLKDTERFSSKAMMTMLMQRGRTEPPKLSLDVLRFVMRMVWNTGLFPAGFVTSRMLIAEDGEQHQSLRNIVNRGFTPKHIAAWEPRVRAIAEENVTGLGSGEPFELVEQLSVPLPVTLICEILGIEPERRADFKRWSDTVVKNVSTTAGREEFLDKGFVDVFVEMVSYLRQICRERRKAPADDLISTIVTGKEALNDYEVVQFVMLILIAGNETTTNLIGNTVNALLDHPDQLAKLAANPGLIDDTIDEGLRFDSPVQLVFRNTTCDVEMHGVTIPEGAIVAPLLGSANRDEREYPDPARFDIERKPRGHFGFGFGKHFCLGSSLARLEARSALEVLLPELPKLTRSDAKREWIDSFLVRGPRSLLLERAN
jgi:cytochrome P450